MLKRLDHVSIGVLDMDKARNLFCDILGGEMLPDAGSSSEGFDWVTFLLGGKKVELVTPHAQGEGGVGQYLAKNGEGFHHLSATVDDIVEARRYFEEKSLRILGYNDTSANFRHFYLHPKDTFGALIQVVEENEGTRSLSGDPAPCKGLSFRRAVVA